MPDLDSILADVREHYQPDPGAKQRIRRTLAVGIAAGTVATASQLSSANAAASGGSLVNGVVANGAALANGSGAALGAGQGVGLAAGGVVTKSVGAGLVVKLSASLGVVAALGAGALQLSEGKPPAPVVTEHVAAANEGSATESAPEVAPLEVTAAEVTTPEVTALEPTKDEATAAEQAPSLEALAEVAPNEPAIKRVSKKQVAAATAPREPSTILEQLGLIREASKALRAGDSAKASRLLDEHQQRFPKSALSSERRGLKLLVHCTNGASAATRAAAKRFVEAAPNAPLAAHVEKQCSK